MAEPLFELKKMLRENFPASTREDAQRLMLAICLMAYSDGELQDEEKALVAALGRGLPELKALGTAEVAKLIVEAAVVLKPFHNRLAAVHAFKGIKSERLRQKCFLIALETALVTGRLSEMEIQVLEKLFVMLELTGAFAERVASGLVLKYR